MKKIILSLFLIASVFESYSAETGFVKAQTRSDLNSEVKIHYRVPENYKEQSGRLYRVLVFFGGRNGDGAKYVGGGMFSKWADELDVFIIAPTFKDDEYWYPGKWSGKALLEGLKKIKEKYDICERHILYYGCSAGSQCANLFPAWKPEICTAWVSHACGVWHKPKRKMRGVPGLVTCGEADPGRYVLSHRFVMESRRKGINILWKSFPNTPHEVAPGSARLARVFLRYHHLRSLDDLDIESTRQKKRKRRIKYVGDDQEGRYWKVGSREISLINKEDRVEFSSRILADAWGKDAKSRWGNYTSKINYEY
jgi:poly(3-hydroxybutyrate) depolymerase